MYILVIATGSSRDLYCVLECDRVHKARTVVRTGDLVFDWDETFELDLLSNKELDFLIYSWDQQYRHKLCYKGSVHLASLVRDSPVHQLALKIEPRGTLYLRLRHTDPYQTFIRKTLRTSATLPPRIKTAGLFGKYLDALMTNNFLLKITFVVESKIFQLCLKTKVLILNQWSHVKAVRFRVPYLH